MTRKDYIVLAEALNSRMPRPLKKGISNIMFQWELDVVAIAEALKRDNPNMDYDKFYEVCIRD